MISEEGKDFVLETTSAMMEPFLDAFRSNKSIPILEDYFIIVCSIVTSIVATLGNGLSKTVSKNDEERRDSIGQFFALIMKTAHEQVINESSINQELH